MKKVCIAALLASVSFAASAQIDLVKEVERDLKASSPDYAAAVAKIQPALTNPQSDKDVLTWYTAGKAEIGLYDKLYKELIVKGTTDKQAMGSALVDAYGDFLKALPLDSVADAKGKIKTKYSKEIVKLVNENYSGINNAAASLFEAGDYMGAYNAWGLYLEIPKNAVLGKNAPKAEPDSIQAQICYNRGLAAWQADDFQKALDAFMEALALGYDKKPLFDYALYMATQVGDKDAISKLSKEGYELYGNEDPKFFQMMINEKIEQNNYDEANKMLAQAIAEQPDNANLYYVQGILDETMDNNEGAIEALKKAISLDPEYAPALFELGRCIFLQASKIDDEASSREGDYQQVRVNQVNPMLKEASGYLEKAYEIDADNMHDAIIILRNVYYFLGDEDNLKRVENL